ncbi:MAG: nicotinate (nicotinamide) nucleotide adenylyltransferase [SAR324 cluster bacterium]|nr:nicotinate (nicotinamide) nucleotide adenylyltransferase [SAR324 cluster bacterium]
MSRTYAIFGGSFNPIHIGHVAVVEQLLQLEVEKIFVIPTSRSPFKQNQDLLPNELRLEMVTRTFQDWNRVVVSDLEIKSNQVQYTYHTLKQLDLQHPDTRWNLVIGWDAYQDFPQWKEAKRIITSASLWVVQRSGLLPENNVSLKDFIVTPTLTHWFDRIVWNEKQQVAYYQGHELVRYLAFETPVIASSDLRSGSVGIEWLPQGVRSLYVDYINSREMIQK